MASYEHVQAYQHFVSLRVSVPPALASGQHLRVAEERPSADRGLSSRQCDHQACLCHRSSYYEYSTESDLLIGSDRRTNRHPSDLIKVPFGTLKRISAGALM